MQFANSEVKKIECNSLLITAAKYAYEKFFSKPYALAPKEKFPREGSINGITIQRPNHALAHSIRTMVFVPFVIKAYKFKHPNSTFDSDLENMQLAILFFVVGRESEASFKDDNVNYKRFKRNSAEAYKNFVLTFQNSFPALKKLIDSGRVDYYKSIIESSVEGNDGLCQISTIAHNLDLMRCYTEEEFANTRKAVISLLGFKDNETFGVQVADSLIDYAKTCLAANGDKILTCKTPRDPTLFIKANTDVLACLAALRGIKEPTFDVQIANTSKPIPTVPPAEIVSKPVANHGNNNSGYQKGLQFEAQKKYQEAYECFYAEALKNDASAQFKVGYYRYKGLMGKQDIEGAKKYLELAAKQGQQDAKATLQKIAGLGADSPKPTVKQADKVVMFKPTHEEYQKGLQFEAQKKYGEAYNCYYAAAQKNDANAQFKVGYYRYKGLTGKQDLEGAKRYFELAAKQGNTDAVSALQKYQLQQTANIKHI